MSMIDTLGHLLPKSFQWNLVYDRYFRKLITGITPSLDAARDNADQVWDDLHPDTCSLHALQVWERQWNLYASSSLSEADRRTRLAAVWQALGGQSPGYITDTLTAQGFPVFTHEWWVLSGSGYPVPRDPRDYLLPAYGGTDSAGRLISNLISTSVKTDEIGAGELWAQAGEARAVAGYYAGYAVTEVGAVYEGPESAHPFYLYLGGATFPDTVNIPVARKEEFENLCQKICPAQQWLVLRVVYV